jgi:hypothetical protein
MDAEHYVQIVGENYQDVKLSLSAQIMEAELYVRWLI